MKKIAFEKELKGRRVVLNEHPLTFEHAEEAFEIIERNRDIFARYFPWADKTHTPEDYFKGFLIPQEGKMDSGEKAEYRILVNNEFVGQISFFDVNFDCESGEIGYWLDKKHYGNGYMREAVQVLEKYLFEAGFNRIVIRHHNHNPRSRNLIEKSGYTHEGTAREHAFLDGKKQDLLIYSKLKSEYREPVES